MKAGALEGRPVQSKLREEVGGDSPSAFRGVTCFNFTRTGRAVGLRGWGKGPAVGGSWQHVPTKEQPLCVCVRSPPKQPRCGFMVLK